MKIAILSLPLYSNYGGILQAYALQSYLKSCGHEVWIINQEFKDETIRYHIKEIINNLIGKKYYDNKKRINKQIEDRSINQFIRKYLDPVTFEVYTISDYKYLKLYNFDAYIVGSDQVWREDFRLKDYSEFVRLFSRKERMPAFLDFVTDATTIKIAYAVSFGVDNWEYSERNTVQISNMLKKFDAISVREDSGVALCKKHLNIEPLHLIDPTMLLSVNEYISLFKKELCVQKDHTLMIYLLNQKNKELANAVRKKINLPLNEIVIASNETISLKQRPSVVDWLRGFYDADYIATDSFHGCVFSILFNKQFIAIDNKTHDSTRLYSLLRQFNLQNRVVVSIQDLTDEKINEKIDFKLVNEILEDEKHKAYSFFKSNLIKKPIVQ